MPNQPPLLIRALRIGDYDRIYALWKDAGEGVGLGESDGRPAIRRFS